MPDFGFVNLPLLESHVTSYLIPDIIHSIYASLQEAENRLLSYVVCDVTCQIEEKRCK